MMLRCRLVLLCCAVARVCGLATTPRPIWLTKPACSSEAALKAAAPLQMLPPRRLQPTDTDARGRSTEGRCLPFALLLQLQRSGANEDLPIGTDIASIDKFRERVLSFAVAQHTARWRADSEFASLGDVVGAVMEFRGWVPTRPRAIAVRAWAARLRTTPRSGCDAAFLFAAAACYGVRVHVHYKTRSGLMADTQFAAPTTAPAEMQPRKDVHIGYCESGDGENHYVGLPAVWER